MLRHHRLLCKQYLQDMPNSLAMRCRQSRQIRTKHIMYTSHSTSRSSSSIMAAAIMHPRLLNFLGDMEASGKKRGYEQPALFIV
jgi:hypothetical protein